MITMNDIIKEGNPILREVANEVPLPPSEEDVAILKQMLEFLINSQDEEVASEYNLRAGIGLAAPQIGLNKRMIALYLTDEKEHLHEYALFNPKIISHSVEETYLEHGEGCLSVDREIPGYVPRYSRVKVKAVDINNKTITLSLKGLPAIAMQHEIDHLNGIMFYDHIDKEDPFKIPNEATTLD